RTAHIEVRAGIPQTHGRAFILLEDIQDIFPEAHHFLCKERNVGFMMDQQGNNILPLRIHHLPGMTIDVALATDTSPRLNAPQLYYHQQYQEVSSTPQQEVVSIQQKDVASIQQKDVASIQQKDVASIRQQLQLQQIQYQQEQEQEHEYRRPQGPDVTPRRSRVSSAMNNRYVKSLTLFETFIKHIQDGQADQANLIRDDFRHHFDSLSVEMARNRALQQQMLEMQQTMLELQQQSLDRLAIIQSRVQAILVQNYELHECLHPRLFIVLPVGPPKLEEFHPSQTRFRLFFLCECGEHTRPVARQSNIPHHIHLAKHEGYEIENPEEFFQHYGTYVLSLLQMFKYGVSVAGFAVPAMTSTRKHSVNVHKANSPSEVLIEDMVTSIDQAIEYLQAFKSMGDINRNVHNHGEDFKEIEDTDLRRLPSFLRNKDTSRPLGNLYRIFTDDGHIKWVCLDHYRGSRRLAAMNDLRNSVAVNGGSYDEHYGRIMVTLQSAFIATHFYKAMVEAKFTQELRLVLKWEVTVADLRALRDALDQANVASLTLTCTPSSATGELLQRKKRADPLWQIITSPKIQAFTLLGYTGFFRKTTMEMAATELRVLRISEFMEWSKDGGRALALITRSPRLAELSLGTTNVNMAYTNIRKAVVGTCHLTKLSIFAGDNDQLSVQFDEDNTQTVVSMDLIVPSLSPDNSLLQTANCITSLHICSRSYVYKVYTPIRDLVSRNPHLTDLKIGCYAAEFTLIFDALYRHVNLDDSSCQLKQVCLYRDNNRLWTTDIRNPHDRSLELLNLNINERAITSLIRMHGAYLTKLRIDTSNWKASHSTILEEITREIKPRLSHLYQRCNNIDDAILDKLSLVIHRSRLEEYELIVDRPFKTNLHPAEKSSIAWVNFICVVGMQLTTFGISCSDPSDWVQALGMADFPAMEKMSFNHAATEKTSDFKDQVELIQEGLDYISEWFTLP
ncbi:hypothetical protein BGZ51_004089, partial [Haplosporangium sp. Z 767]